MGFSMRRWRAVALIAIFTIFGIYHLTASSRQWTQPTISPKPNAPKPSAASNTTPNTPPKTPPKTASDGSGKTHWEKRPERYPVQSVQPLPQGTPKPIPSIQAKAPVLDGGANVERKKRLAAVKESFDHSWAGYKKHAWLQDEVVPVKGGARNTLGGWAATLVDSLDTLWIMGLEEDFAEAVESLDQLDFSYTEATTINVFETTIRYLGGFLAAYDISERKFPKLLVKAVEVAELLMSSFDTPNHMPVVRWNWLEYVNGEAQVAPFNMVVAELGSLSLEFTRLSQLTKNPKYYDAVQRISDMLEEHQSKTLLPGLWPIAVDAGTPAFDRDNAFTLGAMVDSLYEYLPKQYMLLGGLLEQPKKMYEKFMPVAKKHLFFRPLNPDNLDILVSGEVRVTGKPPVYELKPEGQHLTCFVGGMIGMASKIFNRPDELAIAEKLTNGCVWAYESQIHGVAPELFRLVPCNNSTNPTCQWSEEAWHAGIPSLPSDVAAAQKKIMNYRLAPGFTSYPDPTYLLRPEAIESVFMMYRITGDPAWMDKGWRMFQSIEKITRTSIANSAIDDVTKPKPKKIDSMESFWLAETLKYFYLLFSEFDVVNLDEWVLNTEAHPFKRPV
ncbi:hypothetical protein VC83_06042 [Pseudogymnoascus destructans]|uniref:alpha-1,2-Mannosidase n=2 Tax=Pseudogymnoascus destructans TaxID=655981 RepID=L8FT96_PSED2|nr:uncharacterized protein VC83_06042 [Pseudogymnoascus destructans]ELR03703.1 hypothetical protein GMDG_06337 [Pseudogymnoascus destructans 20631-21]OAF57020.1 hypothetical protein VC83_06042 [Pseudogymnoascus destructans]